MQDKEDFESNYISLNKCITRSVSKNHFFVQTNYIPSGAGTAEVSPVSISSGFPLVYPMSLKLKAFKSSSVIADINHPAPSC